jgi:hypothetical protein
MVGRRHDGLTTGFGEFPQIDIQHVTKLPWNGLPRVAKRGGG